jgi:hypothetical protein
MRLFCFLLLPFLARAQITCLDGQTSFDNTTCVACPADSYCQAGVLASCPAHSTSVSPSTLISECNCESGYFRTNVFQCVLCPAGSRCSNNELTTCAAGSSAVAGSSVCTPCAVGTFESIAGSSACQTCPGGLTVLKTTEYTELFDPAVNRSTVPAGEAKVYILRGYLSQSQSNYLTKWSFFASKAGCAVTPKIFGATVLSNALEGNVQFTLRQAGTPRVSTSAGLQTFKFDESAPYFVRTAVPTGTPYLNEFEFFGWEFSGEACIAYDLGDANTHFYWMEFPSDPSGAYVFSGSVYEASRFWSVQITFEHRAMISSTVSTGTASVYDCICPSDSRQLSDGNCQGLCENGKYMVHETDSTCTNCLQGSQCSSSVISACPSGYSSLPGSASCSVCPGPGTHTNIALYMCGLLTTCTAATPIRLGSSAWFGLGTVSVGVGGISNIPSTSWFPGSPVVGMVLNGASDRPYALLQRTIAVTSGTPIAFQFRYMCSGVSCNAAFRVQWSQNAGPYTTVFSKQSVPASSVAAASWVQTSTEFITPAAAQISVRIVAEMSVSSAVVWVSSFEAVSLGQWQYGDIANLLLLETANILVPHFATYSETVESSTIRLINTSFTHAVSGAFSGYPYKVSVWAYGAGSLTLNSSASDSQTWVIASDTLTQYVFQTTVPPSHIQIEAVGTVAIGSPSVSLRSLEIGCQSCLADHWCATQYINTCPQNSISAVGSSLQSDCHCSPGFYGSVTSLVGWTPCSVCDINYFCTGANNGNHRQVCPDGTKSNAGSSVCSPCDQGQICKDGQIGTCPLHSHGPENASVVTDCICDDGYYGTAPNCVRCEPGSYCFGGSKHACTAEATSTPGASTPTECFCDRGYYGLQNAPCVVCEEGSWCWTGVKNACPANMWSPPKSSFTSNCTCEYGYFLSGESCIPCSGGSYKTTRGFSACTLCDAGKFSAATGATSNATCAVCDVGHFTSSPGQVECQPCSAGYHTPVLGSVQCQACWAGSYSLGGVATCTGCSAGSMSSALAAQSSSACTACPVGSWSPGNSSACNICGACSYWFYPQKHSFLVDSMVSVFNRPDAAYIRFAVHTYSSKIFMTLATSVYTVDLVTKTILPEVAIQGPGRAWWFACLAPSQLGNYLYAIQSTYVFRVDLDMSSQWDVVYPSSSATCVVEDATVPGSPLLWIAQLDGVRSLTPSQALLVNSYPVTGSHSICLSPTDTANLYVTGTFGLKKVSKTTGAATSLVSGTVYTVCSFTPDGLFLMLSNPTTKTTWAYSTFDGGVTRILNNAAVSGIMVDSANIILGIDTVGVHSISYAERDSATCSPGKYSSYSGLQLESHCEVCPIGSLCPGGSNITQCTPGTYSAVNGLREQGQCVACPAGSFCTGGAVLQVCPLGSYSLLTRVSSQADCAGCPAGFYCPNTTHKLQCPAHTMSAARSSDLGECICAPGYSCRIIIVVHAEIRLLILRSDFTPDMQTRYINAIALAAGVATGSVHIVSINEVTIGGGRRLLGYNANAVEVHTSIYNSRTEKVSDLNAHLKSQGLPAHRGMKVTLHKEVVSAIPV